MAARPYNCNTLDDYLNWMDQVANESGGYLVEGYLIVDDMLDDHDEVIGAIVPRQRLQFYDGTHIVFHLLVTLDGLVDEYGFNFMRDDMTGICRLDKHPGHEKDVDSLTHLHVGEDHRDETVLPADEYDFDDAIRFVRNYIEEPAESS